MSARRRWARRAGLAAAASLLGTAPLVAADETAPGTAVPELRALASAAAWHDVLEAYRVPELPPPSDAESFIVILDGPAAGRAAPATRPDRARALSAAQQEVERTVAGIGGRVNFRYRMLLNGLAVRLPAGRAEALARLPAVRAVVPVSYLAPAAEPAQHAPSGPAGGAETAAAGPVHVALIDGGIDPTHPWLGAGLGPSHPVIGGADLVDGDGDPTLEPEMAESDPHGTQMASILLRADAYRGLAPERRPRLLSYRVTAAERVEGRVRPLARTDRVLAALERAVDPNADGAPDDAAEVIVIGLARGFDGSGYDPLRAAIDAADRLGSLVVVPAGNDGPTFSRSGSVGGPATARRALVVGGLGAALSPRTVRLRVDVAGAQASTDPLPLIGGAPPAGRLGIAVVQSEGVLGRGDSVDEYTDDRGASRVAGKVAVVVRGGGTLREKARAAAAAGARALAVWDQQGAGVFPALPDGADWPLPVIGLGSRQGAELRELLAGGERVDVAFEVRRGTEAEPGVASFSSRGPTGAGGAAPHVIGPSIGVEAAYPGQDGPRAAPLTGTSAAAALVAARAVRMRIDRPGLLPADVRSLIVANALPLRDGGVRDQGAGALGESAAGRVVFAPAVVSMVARGDRVGARVRVRSLEGGGRYGLVMVGPSGEERPIGPPRRIGAGLSSVDLELASRPGPGQDLGRIEVRDADGAVVGRAPVVYGGPIRLGAASLKAPQVRRRAGSIHVTVKIGGRAIGDNRLRAVRLSSVRMWLVPAGGGSPRPLSGSKQPADWPAGEYRFMLSRRLADGTPLPSGRFRLRVTARGPDGRPLSAESAAFHTPSR